MLTEVEHDRLSGEALIPKGYSVLSERIIPTRVPFGLGSVKADPPIHSTKAFDQRELARAGNPGDGGQGHVRRQLLLGPYVTLDQVTRQYVTVKTRRDVASN